MAGGPSSDLHWPRAVGASAIAIPQLSSAKVADNLAGFSEGDTCRSAAFFLPLADLFGLDSRACTRHAGRSVRGTFATQPSTPILVQLPRVADARKNFAGSALKRWFSRFGHPNNSGNHLQQFIGTEFTHSLEYNGTSRQVRTAARELLSAPTKTEWKSRTERGSEEA